MKGYSQEKHRDMENGSQVLFTAPAFIHFVSRHAQVLQEFVKAWEDENNHGQHSIFE